GASRVFFSRPSFILQLRKHVRTTYCGGGAEYFFERFICFSPAKKKMRRLPPNEHPRAKTKPDIAPPGFYNQRPAPCPPSPRPTAAAPRRPRGRALACARGAAPRAAVARARRRRAPCGQGVRPDVSQSDRGRAGARQERARARCAAALRLRLRRSGRRDAASA